MYSYLSGDVLSRAGNFSLNSVNLVLSIGSIKKLAIGKI